MTPTCGPLDVKKKLDVASGPLADALTKGRVIAEAVLASRKAGDSVIDYCVVTLKKATVTSWTQSSTGDQPAEEVELLPRAVQLAYRAQKPDGSYDAAITTTIDCTGGTK